MKANLKSDTIIEQLLALQAQQGKADAEEQPSINPDAAPTNDDEGEPPQLIGPSRPPHLRASSNAENEAPAAVQPAAPPTPARTNAFSSIERMHARRRSTSPSGRHQGGEVQAVAEFRDDAVRAGTSAYLPCSLCFGRADHRPFLFGIGPRPALADIGEIPSTSTMPSAANGDTLPRTPLNTQVPLDSLLGTPRPHGAERSPWRSPRRSTPYARNPLRRIEDESPQPSTDARRSPSPAADDLPRTPVNQNAPLDADPVTPKPQGAEKSNWRPPGRSTPYARNPLGRTFEEESPEALNARRRPSPPTATVLDAEQEQQGAPRPAPSPLSPYDNDGSRTPIASPTGPVVPAYFSPLARPPAPLVPTPSPQPETPPPAAIGVYPITPTNLTASEREDQLHRRRWWEEHGYPAGYWEARGYKSPVYVPWTPNPVPSSEVPWLPYEGPWEDTSPPDGRGAGDGSSGGEHPSAEARRVARLWLQYQRPLQRERHDAEAEAELGQFTQSPRFDEESDDQSDQENARYEEDDAEKENRPSDEEADKENVAEEDEADKENTSPFEDGDKENLPCSEEEDKENTASYEEEDKENTASLEEQDKENIDGPHGDILSLGFPPNFADDFDEDYMPRTPANRLYQEQMARQRQQQAQQGLPVVSHPQRTSGRAPRKTSSTENSNDTQATQAADSEVAPRHHVDFSAPRRVPMAPRYPEHIIEEDDEHEVKDTMIQAFKPHIRKYRRVLQNHADELERARVRIEGQEDVLALARKMLKRARAKIEGTIAPINDSMEENLLMNWKVNPALWDGTAFLAQKPREAWHAWHEKNFKALQAKGGYRGVKRRRFEVDEDEDGDIGDEYELESGDELVTPPRSGEVQYYGSEGFVTPQRSFGGHRSPSANILVTPENQTGALHQPPGSAGSMDSFYI